MVSFHLSSHREEEGETQEGFLEAEAPQLNVEEERLGKERV